MTTRTSPPARFRPSLALIVIGLAFAFVIPNPARATAASEDSIQLVSRARLLEAAVFSEIDSVRHRFALQRGHFTTAYQSAVVTSARDETDPRISLSSGAVLEFGIWGLIPVASVTTDATRIVDDWVYKDGWNGSNTFNRDCTAPSAPGCGSHRRAILSVPPYPGARLYVDVGAVTTDQNGFPGVSIAALLIWDIPPSVHQRVRAPS